LLVAGAARNTSRPYKSTHLYGQLVLPAAPTVPFVETAAVL